MLSRQATVPPPPDSYVHPVNRSHTGAEVIWIFTVRRSKVAAPRPVQVHPRQLRTSAPIDARLRPFVAALADLLVADLVRYPVLNRIR